MASVAARKYKTIIRRNVTASAPVAARRQVNGRRWLFARRKISGALLRWRFNWLILETYRVDKLLTSAEQKNSQHNPPALAGSILSRLPLLSVVTEDE